MDAVTAVSILGCNHTPTGVPERNMVRALRLLPALNTREENERLDAALWACRHSTEFRAEQDARRARPHRS
jgi:hypothetical protein